MPIGWRPVTTKIEELITEERAKIDAIQARREWLAEPLPTAVRPTPTLPERTPFLTEQVEEYIPPQLPFRRKVITDEYIPPQLPQLGRQTVSREYIPPQLPKVGKIIPQMGISPQLPTYTPAPIRVQPPKPAIVPTIETPVSVSFWQRALQVFVAPFKWVEETIIKPGEALLGTTAGFVPEVERKPGEDFWEWKKRSWAGWKAPGININVPWSDDPWRVDIKGVMELAPWLLIPGAGQVGTGARAARGVAGILGKVAKPIGYAVEYSPWGLAEKTAGVAIKGGFRAVGAVSERVSTTVGEKLFGKYVPPPVPAEVTKLTEHMKLVAMPSYRAFQKAKGPELRLRQAINLEEVENAYKRGAVSFEEVRKARDIARKGGIKEEFGLTPEALLARQEKTIRLAEVQVVSGELSQKQGEALIKRIKENPAFTTTQWTKEEGKVLHDMVAEGVEGGVFERAESADAFWDFILKGTLPEEHNLRDWTKVFGVEFAKAVGQLDSPSRVNQALDALNIPRAIIASWDVSATARQGLILGLLHPTQVPKWFGRQVKALFSEKWAFEIDDAMRADPLFKEFQRSGAYIAPLREATFTTAEEMFASRTARHIPGIRRSERAFATYLNQARFDSFKSAYNVMTAQGATDAQYKLLGNFLDIASGRGKMPASLERFMPALNLTLFSPRLQAATLQLPRQLGRMLLSDNPYMRKEAAKALVTFVGGGVGLLMLLKNTGVAKVEGDPRSGDFGKIQIGETRLDIWRGYLQYTRFAAQMLMGESKSAYGNMNKAERGEKAWRFIQSKASPAVGLLVDLLRGETYMGDPIFNDTTGFTKAAREKVIPLAVQDIIDAMEMNGVNGLATAAPAMLGVGALTYINDFVRVKEKIANEMGFDSWDDIDPKAQREIENRNAELQAATIAFDRQIMGTAWGDWQLAGKAIEDMFSQNVEDAVAKYRQDGLGVDFREKVSDAWTKRRGAYQAREAEARFEDIVKRMKVRDPLESLVGLGPEGTAIRVYQDALYGEDMYDEFGDYRFDEADERKELLRQQLGQEMFDYVEQYQAVRYEDFPIEFQELQRAKAVMKSYWAVGDTVARLFGQGFADSRAGQRLIAKRRKQLRLTNREIAQAYNQFYSQNE